MKKVLIIILAVLFSADIFSQSAIHREDIEWLDVWVSNTNKKDLPRALLIGNSITRSYYKEVESQLKGVAYVAQLATSKSLGDPALLQEIALILKNTPFDVVHFNNGLHGWKYTEDEYRASFPEMLDIIRENAPNAKLIWASSTPIQKDDLNQNRTMDRIRARNMIALECIEGQGIVVDDLFTVANAHPEYYEGGDGVHLAPVGVKAIGTVVANVIKEVIK
ncbi:SGNH/GDSL hydrolase family protein [Viscerimonas tarda]